MRRTKIICTLGPATEDEAVLRTLIRSGMDVARLNFSHGTHEEHARTIETIKRLRKEENRYIAILLDTKGPEIRTGVMENGSATLEAGKLVTLTTEDVPCTAERISVTYRDLPKHLRAGHTVLIDDGLIALEVVRTTETEIVCSVVNGGVLKDRKGINIPNVPLHMPYLSERDKADLLFGIKHDVDFIAASFVRCADDVVAIKGLLEKNGGEKIRVISKIENREGVTNIDEIIRLSTGIMVARGDMGVEIPMEELPGVQKTLINKCYRAGKVAITATQMLDSMIRNPRPTRAEVTDVANAVYDGTSAVMLSGETSIGKYAVESVCMMGRIVCEAESNIDYAAGFRAAQADKATVADAIGHAACMTAHDIGAKAILTVTNSGSTARMVSRYRPQCPIIATSTSYKVCCQLSLSWGVIPVLSEMKETSDEVFDHSVDIVAAAGLVRNGDVIVMTGGIPVGISGTTNMLKVHLVGDVLCQGTGLNPYVVSSNVCVATNAAEAVTTFTDGNILVVPHTDNSMLCIMKKASGIITEERGSDSHAAIVGMTLDIPVIVGASHATKILKSGTTVTMDARSGLVYNGTQHLDR